VNGFFDAFPPSNSLEWRISFQIALNNFLDGEWEAALACLDECLMVHPDDGPSKVVSPYTQKPIPCLAVHPDDGPSKVVSPYSSTLGCLFQTFRV
jgi:hypothetical protein